MDVYMNLSYDKDFVYIEVIDRGVGILDIELAKTPMFTTKPDDERSGLGFTIMDVFSDEMTIESSVGDGCSVKIIKKIDKVEDIL
jgi:stage II sporulation protein AB (anti-sigma F factor)